MAYWTTEEVADFLEITPEKVYESRRRKEYPGIIGKQRGRRLMFDADLVQAGPTAPESTNDPLVALLWTAQGIEAKLVEIIQELRAQRPVPLDLCIEGSTERTCVCEKGSNDE